MSNSQGRKTAQAYSSEVDSLYQGSYHTVRRALSKAHFLETLVSILAPLAALYFFIFAWLVYAFREHPVDQEPSPSLIKASQYGPTLFPIAFAAVVGRFLQNVAAYKLEKGATIMTLEYLLHCRTVFTTLLAPFALRTFNIFTPILVVMWALSPLGGQASLRVISTGVLSTTAPQNFTYLAFVSPFTNGGAGSSSSELLPPTNFAIAFNTTLSSSEFTFFSLADTFGTVERLLTTAFCNVSMSYVEVQVECHGMSCHSLKARRSPNPATHRDPDPIGVEPTSVFNGLGQDSSTSILHLNFFPDFVNATNPSIACDTATCTTSGIEGYLADPSKPFSFSQSPRLPDVGNDLFSQRMT
ncbi:hypothetical protein F4808DRAFT_213228 [Astrocystis sublimbata]|nr:hypothetical protein F4808DRAFT_213228 [Astrocystis sublimbata]